MLVDHYQVAHQFQQKLSAEKTPTLGYALPAFEAMISKWRRLQRKIPELATVIESGIEKLEEYRARAGMTPVYALSMRKLHPISHSSQL